MPARQTRTKLQPRTLTRSALRSRHAKQGLQFPAIRRLSPDSVQCARQTPSKLHPPTVIQRVMHRPRVEKGSLSARTARQLHDRAPTALLGLTKMQLDIARLHAKSSQCAGNALGSVLRQQRSELVQHAAPTPPHSNHQQATGAPRAQTCPLVHRQTFRLLHLHARPTECALAQLLATLTPIMNLSRRR